MAARFEFRNGSTILLAFLLLCAGTSAACAAGGVEEIVNYREYSAKLSSSGQPDKGQLRAARDAGFERVVFLAFSDSEGSLEHEDHIVRDLGMDYAQVPVVWESPQVADFRSFAGIMQANPDKRTLVHCQVNFRASSFSFLYRVLYLQVPMAEAKDDLDSVWVPNRTWREWIFAVLEEHGVSPHCDACLWSDD